MSYEEKSRPLRRRRLRVPPRAAADSGRVQFQRLAIYGLARASRCTGIAALLQDRDLIESAANSLIIAIACHASLRPSCGTLAAYALWKRSLRVGRRARSISRW